MKRTSMFTIAVLAAVVALAPPSGAGGRPLSADLSGANEVPATGDPDATGHAALTLNQGQGEICYEIEVANVDTIGAGHIHRGVAGEPGPVVVNLQVSGDGPFAACVDASKSIIKEIRQNPEAFYVNLHNAAFPGGALRGQLEK